MSTANATLMDHVHGVVNNRCSHPDCEAAFARWTKQYKLDQLRGIHRTVDGDRARRVLYTLEGAGWSRRSIAAAAGISATAISRIAHGQPTVRVHVVVALESIDVDTVPSTPSNGTSEPFVPRRGTQRRIQALMTLGWTHAEMERRSGVRTCVLANQQGRWVTRSTHDKIATLYREISARPGPSAATRERARRRGYPGPLDWDDIDLDDAPIADEVDEGEEYIDENVVERILAGDNLPANLAERRAVVAAWPRTSRSLADLAGVTGWKVERYYAEAVA